MVASQGNNRGGMSRDHGVAVKKNPVARCSGRVNRPATHKDRRQAELKGSYRKRKHKGEQYD